LLWDSEINQKISPPSYKFEKWCLLREDFSDVVSKSWNAPTKSKTAIDRWQEKVRRFSKTTKGCSKNIESDLRQLKKEMMEEYDCLDIKSEHDQLSDIEVERMKVIRSEMQKLWLKEEVKAKQRS
jgi:hypothetical protein